MQTELIQTETKQSTELAKVVEQSGLALNSTKAKIILEHFNNYFEIAADWELKAKTLVVTKDDQKAEMKMAREGRLFLRDKRIDIENKRKELKNDALREGKAIDGIANVLKGLIEPIEQYLDKQENFTKNRLLEEARERERIEAEKAEQERLRLEDEERKEQERICKENERLRKEQDGREQELQKEREERDRDIREADQEREKAQKEQEERELRIQELEREKEEAEQKAKDAIANAVKSLEEAEQRAIDAEERAEQRLNHGIVDSVLERKFGIPVFTGNKPSVYPHFVNKKIISIRILGHDEKGTIAEVCLRPDDVRAVIERLQKIESTMYLRNGKDE